MTRPCPAPPSAVARPTCGGRVPPLHTISCTTSSPHGGRRYASSQGLRKPALLCGACRHGAARRQPCGGDVAKSRLSGIEERMRRIFSTAMPNTLRLHRLLSPISSSTSSAAKTACATTICWPCSQSMARARGVEARSSVTTLRYNDHKLELTLPALDAQQRQCSPNGSRAAV